MLRLRTAVPHRAGRRRIGRLAGGGRPRHGGLFPSLPSTTAEAWKRVLRRPYSARSDSFSCRHVVPGNTATCPEGSTHAASLGVGRVGSPSVS